MPQLALTHLQLHALRTPRHFWINSAAWSELVSIISMWPLPLIPFSGSEIRSTLPPMPFSAARYLIEARLSLAHSSLRGM